MLGVVYGGGWAPALAVVQAARQHVAVSPGAKAGEEHRYEGTGDLPARALVEQVLGRECGVSSQWNWAACSHGGGARAAQTDCLLDSPKRTLMTRRFGSVLGIATTSWKSGHDQPLSE